MGMEKPIRANLFRESKIIMINDKQNKITSF